MFTKAGFILRTFILSLILGITCIGCGYLRIGMAIKEALGITKDVHSLIVLANDIVYLLNEFSEQSHRFSVNINEIQNTMIKGFNDGHSTKEVALFWEDEWKGVHQQYNGLVKQLLEIDERTGVYFSELTSNNLNISDTTLQRMDAEQNTLIKMRYEEERSKASESLLMAEKMLRKGDDFQSVLRNQVLRSSIEENINIIKDITSQANALTVSIDHFNQNCQPLFQSQ